MRNARYAIIQQGQCIWGVGNSIEECIADANLWLDADEAITGFEPGDELGDSQGGLTDWTSGRRCQAVCGLLITDDPEVIREYKHGAEVHGEW